ncbi:hypothetical protein [Microcoleus sp. herbarium12]|uniref:hypothetical protein n=1 Tax=Microcoleus sp. herbarium12 TaxID=3055437 RepID=UPI002FCF4E70
MMREEALGQTNLVSDQKITKLEFSGWELQELPPEIGKCTQLKSSDRHREEIDRTISSHQTDDRKSIE